MRKLPKSSEETVIEKNIPQEITTSFKQMQTGNDEASVPILSGVSQAPLPVDSY